MLVLCVVLLFGLILSFNTTGNESLQFDNKYDVSLTSSSI